MAINSDVDISLVLNSLNKKPECLQLSSSRLPQTIVRWEKGDGDDQPTDEEINAEWERLKTAKAAIKYQGDRAEEYPSIGDQLDMQYWDQINGTSTWKDAIAKVKTDNPKPS